jgi:hypothetical protein
VLGPRNVSCSCTRKKKQHSFDIAGVKAQHRAHGHKLMTCAVLCHAVPCSAVARYRIHCLGHSLGGGVAALAAYLLRNSPDWREQLKDASGVMATGTRQSVWKPSRL